MQNFSKLVELHLLSWVNCFYCLIRQYYWWWQTPPPPRNTWQNTCKYLRIYSYSHEPFIKNYSLKIFGRNTYWITDDNKSYLNTEDYNKFKRLESEYRGGLYNLNSMDCDRLKTLRRKSRNNKKSGRTLNINI